MKSKLFTFIILIIFVFAGCKRDFTCKCTYKDVIGQEGEFSWEIEDAKKKDAKEACNEFSAPGWKEFECVLEK